MVKIRKYLTKSFLETKDLIRIIPLSVISSFLLIMSLKQMVFHFKIKSEQINLFGELISKFDFIKFSNTNFSSNSLIFVSNLGIMINFFVLIVVFSLVLSGILGSLNDYHYKNSFKVSDNLIKYFKELFKFNLISIPIFLILMNLFILDTSVFFTGLSFLVIVFLGYFLYGVPFFIVNLDLDFDRSLHLNVLLGLNLIRGSSDYLNFVIKFLGILISISMLLVPFLINLNWLLVTFLSLFLGFINLILFNSALYFFKDLTPKILLE